MTVQSLLCKIGTDLGIDRLHRYTKGTRVKGFMVRRCKACSDRQELSFPGRKWVSVNFKRARRPKVQMQPPAIGTDDERLVTGEQP